jgi:hypothetical protein
MSGNRLELNKFHPNREEQVMQEVKHICALCYTVGTCVAADNYYICADITACVNRVVETIFPGRGISYVK